MLCTETLFKYEDTYRLKLKGWRKIYHANTNQKEADVTILVSDRADCRARKIFKDK